MAGLHPAISARTMLNSRRQRSHRWAHGSGLLPDAGRGAIDITIQPSGQTTR
jgi:hypothetical protein